MSEYRERIDKLLEEQKQVTGMLLEGMKISAISGIFGIPLVFAERSVLIANLERIKLELNHTADMERAREAFVTENEIHNRLMKNRRPKGRVRVKK